MNLFVYQMVQLQIVHEADGYTVVEGLAAAAVSQLNLTVSAKCNALPFFSVVSVCIQFIINVTIQQRLPFFREFLPACVDIIVCHFQCIHDVDFVRTIEYGCADFPAQCLCRQGQVGFQYLPDIHTGRNTQRVQHDIQRTAVRQEGHILYRQYTGNNTLVAVTARHLVTNRDFTLLCNINTNQLVYAGAYIIAVFSCEYLYVYNDTCFAVRYTQGGISNLSCLFAEDGTQQSFLCCQLCFALRCYLTNQNIIGAYLGTDADDTSVIQILQRILAHVGNISCDFFRPKLCVSCVCLKFTDMNGGINILLYQLFAQQNSILVVVAFPSHEADQRVLAQCQLALAGGSTVCDNLVCLYSLSQVYNRLLVQAGALVGSLIFNQLIYVSLRVIISNHDFICGNSFHNTGVLCNNADTGVLRSLVFHTCADNGGICYQQGYCLTLHVGAHQRTVRVIVFQEGNQCSRNGYHLLGRNVHQLYLFSVYLDDFLFASTGNLLMHEMSFFIQRLIRLCYVVDFFLVRSHIDKFICNNGLLTALVNLSVGCLNEAVFIDACEGCQCIDQANVRAFWCLNGAHSAVMRMVNVTHLEAGSVSGQTAGAQCGKSSLVCQLGQRVILVHELRQLRAAEEFLNCRCNRAHVNQCLWCYHSQILCCHSFAHHTLHSGQTDAELVLQQLANGTDTSVAQMVDIVHIAIAVIQMDHIVNGCKNIFQCNMLRQQLMDVFLDCRLHFLCGCVFLQQLCQHRIVNSFLDAEFLCRQSKFLQIAVNLNGLVAQDFYLLFLRHDIQIACAAVLNPVAQIQCQNCAFLCDNLACHGINHVFCQNCIADTVSQRQLFVEFITTNLRQVISLGIKEHAIQQRSGAFYCRGLAGTQLFVNLNQTFFIGFCNVLFQCCQNLRLFAKQFNDFRIGANAHRTNQNRYRHLSGSVNSYIKYVVGICFIFQPSTSVGDDCGGKHVDCTAAISPEARDSRS